MLNTTSGPPSNFLAIIVAAGEEFDREQCTGTEAAEGTDRRKSNHEQEPEGTGKAKKILVAIPF